MMNEILKSIVALYGKYPKAWRNIYGVACILLLIYQIVILADRDDWKNEALKSYVIGNKNFLRCQKIEQENLQLRVYKAHYISVAKQVEELKKKSPIVHEILVDALYRVAERYGLPPDSLIEISKGEMIYSKMWLSENNTKFEY